MSRGQFKCELLPSWETYAQQCGMQLRGAGKERRAVCEIHGGERDSLTISLRGPWQCKACGAAGGDVLAYHRALHGLRFVDAARDLGAWVEASGVVNRPAAARIRPVVAFPMQCPDKDAAQARKQSIASDLWDKSQPILPTTPGGLYLTEARKCVLPPAGSDLRELSDLRLFGFSGPALVGRMSLAIDHRVMAGLHITWLRRAAQGWVRGERRYLGPKKGAVVRLWPDEAVTHGLGITEGVETALSLAHAFTPVWAALDAGNLAAFPVLEGVESLLIGADHDAAGIDAARTCAALWNALGREVRIAIPPTPKTDLNDVLRAA